MHFLETSFFIHLLMESSQPTGEWGGASLYFQRVLSASVGGCAVALLGERLPWRLGRAFLMSGWTVTPFDVVKARLQAQSAQLGRNRLNGMIVSSPLHL